MAVILSIQSHVAYGYVGNRVATFALQRMKHDVITINTVQFSNHTGYGEWQGEVFSLEHIQSIWHGIKQRIDLTDIDALLTGYLGNQSLAKFIDKLNDELKETNPNFLYCMDPVFGDIGRDLFVPAELAEYYRTRLIGQSHVITPNHYELNYLCQAEINSIKELKQQTKPLFQRGLQQILVTSYLGQECDANEIGMVHLTLDDCWLIKTPRLPFTVAPNGSGDLVSAITLDLMIKGLPPQVALERLASQIYRIFQATKKSGQRELQLIAAQDVLVSDEHLFTAEQC